MKARFYWDSHEPHFEIMAGEFRLLELNDPSYDVVVESGTRRFTSRLVRQPWGRYIFAEARKHLGARKYRDVGVRAHWATPTVTLSVISRDGATVYTETVQLWDATEDVSVFRVTEGTRAQDAYATLSCVREYAIIVPSDVRVEGAHEQQKGGEWHCWRVYKGNPPVTASLGGEIIWTHA